MVDTPDPFQYSITVLADIAKLTKSLEGSCQDFTNMGKSQDLFSRLLTDVLEFQKVHGAAEKLPLPFRNLMTEIKDTHLYLQKQKMKIITKQISVCELTKLVHLLLHTMEFHRRALTPYLKLKRSESTEKTISLFMNKRAEKEWLKYFKDTEQLPWVEFLPFLRHWVFVKFGKELSEGKLVNIMRNIDQKRQMQIRYDQWDEFVETCEQLETLEPLTKDPPEPLLYQEAKIQPVKLILAAVSPFEPKPQHQYRLGSKIRIAEEVVIYDQAFTKKKTAIAKKWDLEGLIIGREKGQEQSVDVPFDHHLSTIDSPQCQIVMKDFGNYHGFYLGNLSSSEELRTCLRIGKKPYLLCKGMILKFGPYTAVVRHIEPNPDDNTEDDDPDFFFVDMNSRQEIRPWELPTKGHKPHHQKKGEKAVPDPQKYPLYLEFEISDREDFEESEPMQEYLQPYYRNKSAFFKLGSDFDNDVKLKKCEPVQMNVFWEAKKRRWMVFSDIEEPGKGTYLEMYNWEDQFMLGIKAGKVTARLRNEMRISMGGNEWVVQTKEDQ